MNMLRTSLLSAMVVGSTMFMGGQTADAGIYFGIGRGGIGIGTGGLFSNSWYGGNSYYGYPSYYNYGYTPYYGRSYNNRWSNRNWNRRGRGWNNNNNNNNWRRRSRRVRRGFRRLRRRLN